MDIGLWWIWVVSGLVLFGLEVLIPGTFFFMFFGAGAFVAGIAQLFFHLSAEYTWALFSITSVGSLLIFRSRLKSKKCVASSPGFSNSVVGKKGSALESIAPNAEGKVEVFGSSWTGRNDGATAIMAGQKIVVVAQDELQLVVKSED